MEFKVKLSDTRILDCVKLGIGIYAGWKIGEWGLKQVASILKK